MRYLLALLIASCCGVGYAQEPTEVAKPSEVTTPEEGSGSKEVAQVDQCGCGKKDHKPKV